MIPQIIKYNKEKSVISRLDSDSNTLLVNSSDLQWGNMAWPPVLLISGLEDANSKFSFVKAFLDDDHKIKHCKYKNDTTGLILIVYNN